MSCRVVIQLVFTGKPASSKGQFPQIEQQSELHTSFLGMQTADAVQCIPSVSRFQLLPYDTHPAPMIPSNKVSQSLCSVLFSPFSFNPILPSIYLSIHLLPAARRRGHCCTCCNRAVHSNHPLLSSPQPDSEKLTHVTSYHILILDVDVNFVCLCLCLCVNTGPNIPPYNRPIIQIRSRYIRRSQSGTLASRVDYTVRERSSLHGYVSVFGTYFSWIWTWAWAWASIRLGSCFGWGGLVLWGNTRGHGWMVGDGGFAY